MKGPHERLKYDLRRLWECPACNHRERTGGDAASQFCRCQESVELSKRRPMRLVEDGARRVTPLLVVRPQLAGLETTPSAEPAATETPPPIVNEPAAGEPGNAAT